MELEDAGAPLESSRDAGFQLPLPANIGRYKDGRKE